MARRIVCALLCALGTGCAAHETPHIGFPVLPPIEGADPSIRRKRVIQIPTQVLVQRDGNRAEVEIDPRSFKPVEIQVGEKMVIGTRSTITLLPEEERGSITLYDDVPRADRGALDVGPGAAEVQVRVEVFETDIPAQHLWQPTSGKYLILGEWRLRGKVRPR